MIMYRTFRTKMRHYWKKAHLVFLCNQFIMFSRVFAVFFLQLKEVILAWRSIFWKTFWGWRALTEWMWSNTRKRHRKVWTFVDERSTKGWPPPNFLCVSHEWRFSRGEDTETSDRLVWGTGDQPHGWGEISQLSFSSRPPCQCLCRWI